MGAIIPAIFENVFWMLPIMDISCLVAASSSGMLHIPTEADTKKTYEIVSSMSITMVLDVNKLNIITVESINPTQMGAFLT